ncbi:hypothetical protein [Flexivirga alba]|uniref:ABC transmembrane type-1 domain-containing protein n=1 Tax=Flexivirga alba TaxID=702742 RepID=A0ABW2ABM1_9MICO
MTRLFTRVAELATLPALLIVTWWFASERSTSPYFPPLRVIIRALFDWLPDGFGRDVMPSLINLLSGFALAVVVGIALGVLLGRVAVLGAAFSPIIEFARSIPLRRCCPSSFSRWGRRIGCAFWSLRWARSGRPCWRPSTGSAGLIPVCST